MARRKKVKRTRCPKCRGTGVDPSLLRRYTTGGHNDRACPRCNGECYIDAESPHGTGPRSSASSKEEGRYVCDACGEEIVIPIDLSAGHTQEYVEDCPVCCRPNVIHVELDGGDIRVWAEGES